MFNHSIRITRFRGPAGSRLTKRFDLDEKGRICKVSAPVFADGTGETIELHNLTDVEELITGLNANEAIATGVFDVKRCDIVTVTNLSDDLVKNGVRSRSKEYMQQPSPGLALLDHDLNPWMPEQLRCASPMDLMDKLENAIPELSSLGYSGTTSCSAGVFNTATKAPYSGGGGLHVYLAMEGNDLDALRCYLEVRLWNADLGFMAFARNGAMLTRCLIDISVLSPERLIYEADPILGDGLSRKPREWQHREGPALSGDLTLTADEIAEYERRVSEAKADPKTIEESERLQDEYYAGRIRTVAKRKSITEDEAKKLIPRQSIADRESAERILLPDDVVEIDGKHIAVAELLKQGAKFDGTAMPDPIEGSAYGKTTAKFYWNNGEHPCIHSFAHGLNVTYRLGHPLTRVLLATTQEPELVQPLDPTGFPHRREAPNGNISLPATIENVEHMLNAYDIHVRYDVIKKRLNVTIPGLSGSPENFANVAINHIISMATLNGISTGQLANYIDALGDKYQVNPVADWITGKPWDGIDRLADLYATLHTRDDYPVALKEALLFRWLLSATAAALKSTGFYGRGVLTLQGPQGVGKTSWIRSLISDPMLQENVVLLGHHLDAGSKDSLVTAVSHWIVEIGELDSSFRKDVARLKGFITGDRDKVRRPYARADSEYQRRTVFCASVNDENFLVDATGNSRWWTVPVVTIDYQHDINMQQVFAQLAQDLDAGAQWWLTKEEEALLETQNRHHRAISSIEEMLAAAMDFELPKEKWVNRSPVETLQAIGFDRPTNPQCKECANFFRTHGWPRKRIQGYYKWLIPLRTEHNRFP